MRRLFVVIFVCCVSLSNYSCNPVDSEINLSGQKLLPFQKNNAESTLKCENESEAPSLKPQAPELITSALASFLLEP